MDVTPKSSLQRGVPACSISLATKTTTPGALMGHNMQKTKACITERRWSEPAYGENENRPDVGRMVLCENDGTAEYVDASK